MRLISWMVRSGSEHKTTNFIVLMLTVSARTHPRSDLSNNITFSQPQSHATVPLRWQRY
jgi:hypothetical protein